MNYELPEQAADPSNDMIKKVLFARAMGSGGPKPAGGGLGQLGGPIGQLVSAAGLASMSNKPQPEPGQLATRPSIPKNENLGFDGVYRSTGE